MLIVGSTPTEGTKLYTSASIGEVSGLQNRDSNES